jgi:hypothetical protein
VAKEDEESVEERAWVWDWVDGRRGTDSLLLLSFLVDPLIDACVVSHRVML